MVLRIKFVGIWVKRHLLVKKITGIMVKLWFIAVKCLWTVCSGFVEKNAF